MTKKLLIALVVCAVVALAVQVMLLVTSQPPVEPERPGYKTVVGEHGGRVTYPEAIMTCSVGTAGDVHCRPNQ